MLKQLNLPPEAQVSLCDENGDYEKATKPWEMLPVGHTIGTPYPLFKELVRVTLSLELAFPPTLCYSLPSLFPNAEAKLLWLLGLMGEQKDEDVNFFREKFAGSQADRRSHEV